MELLRSIAAVIPVKALNWCEILLLVCLKLCIKSAKNAAQFCIKVKGHVILKLIGDIGKNIYYHTWKELVEISKHVKFGKDRFTNCEDMNFQKSKFLIFEVTARRTVQSLNFFINSPQSLICLLVFLEHGFFFEFL